MNALPPEFEEQPDSQLDSGGYLPEDNPSADVVEESQDDLPDAAIFSTQLNEEGMGEEFTNPNMDSVEKLDDNGEFDTHIQEVEQATQETEYTPQYSFEDLTLAEAMGQFFRAPQATLRAFRQVAQQPLRTRMMIGDASSVPLIAMPVVSAPTIGQLVTGERSAFDQHEAVKLGLQLSSFIVGLWGSSILANAPLRTEALALDVGAPFLIIAYYLWLVAEIYGDWPSIRAGWERFKSRTKQDERADLPDKRTSRPETWTGLHPARVFMALGGLMTSLLALRFTTNNLMTIPGFLAWMASIILWVSAVAPSGWGVLPSIQWIRERLRWRRDWTFWALLLIMLLGAMFRLSNLADTPPEMTSDHVEKILDSQRVVDGQTQVFFPNNGGREGFQMVAMAFITQVFGLDMNFTTLKLLSAVEGLIAILAMFWMGREIVGAEDRKLGNLVGLLLAALVAASYWHTALSRLGLRIVLTTLVTALLLIFLARAMRSNRRGDFIKAGLVLGFGLYTYQAVRMLPVVIILGIGVAFIFNARKAGSRGRYIINFATLILVSFVVFVPLFGFALQYPEDFWRRTSGRLLGDDIIQTTDENGQIVQRSATIEERLQAFNQNYPILTNNIRNALLMFNWKGDVAWINAAPNRPAMDMFTGTFFVLGLAAWLARAVRRRDLFSWLLPAMLFIMLLPSALSIAYPVENPSHTRTSGALPEAYLIAALPLALIVTSMTRLIRGDVGKIVAGAFVVLTVLGAYSINSSLYFGTYRESYLDSSLPYTEAGRILRGFAESDGSYGNAYMIGYPYWWDHRAIGIEAGRTDWPNGIISSRDIPGFLMLASQKTDRYRFDPNIDILFFYASQDDETQLRLEELFPQGHWQLRMSYQGDDDYKLYRVPALGLDRFNTWVTQHTR
jgi:hypothetical protein